MLKYMISVILALAPVAVDAATIRVWEHFDYGGESMVIDSAVARLEGRWNDRISSFRVESGQWEVCRDWDFRNCRTVGVDSPEVASLDGGWGGWNDTISSLRPVGAAAVTNDPQAVAERLYLALLGRPADPQGLDNATRLVAAGEMSELVSSLRNSDEYAGNIARMSPDQVLDQIYNGLFGRPADNAAEDRYLADVARGDIEQVVLDLVASDQFASVVGRGGVGVPSGAGPGVDYQAQGSGTVVWGVKGQPWDVSAATVNLRDDGTFSMSFAGPRQHQLDGTWTRTAGGDVEILTVQLPTKPAIEVDGTMMLENNQLARIDVTSGLDGTEWMLYTFVAQGYELPREQALCHDAIRSRLGKGEEIAFLAPERTRVGSERWDITGDVVILSQHETVEYRCELDAGGDRVLQASVSGM